MRLVLFILFFSFTASAQLSVIPEKFLFGKDTDGDGIKDSDEAYELAKIMSGAETTAFDAASVGDCILLSDNALEWAFDLFTVDIGGIQGPDEIVAPIGIAIGATTGNATYANRVPAASGFPFLYAVELTAGSGNTKFKRSTVSDSTNFVDVTALLPVTNGVNVYVCKDNTSVTNVYDAIYANSLQIRTQSFGTDGIRHGTIGGVGDTGTLTFTGSFLNRDLSFQILYSTVQLW